MDQLKPTAVLKTTREDLIALLALLDVELPPKTKLTKDALEKHLRKALDFAQDVSHVVPPGSKVLDIAKYPSWDEEESARKAVQRQTWNEASLGFANRFLGAPEPTEEQLRMLSIRQALVTLSGYWEQDRKHFILQDKDQQSAITMRVVDVHKFDKSTPVLLVLYMNGTQENSRGESWVQQNAKRIAMVSLQIPAQSLLLRLLENNAPRIPKSFKVKREPKEKNFFLSFLLPVAPIEPKQLGALNARTGCSICGETAGKKCAGCYAILYCSEECQKEDWKAHKSLCKSLKGATWIPITFQKMTLPSPKKNGSGKMTTMMWNNNSVLGREGSMQIISNDEEGNKAPVNTHGTDPFVMKVQYNPAGGTKAMWLYDRNRTIDGEYPEPQPGQDREAFDRIHSVMMTQGARLDKLFCWARRVGDWELLLTVDRLPDQGAKW